MPGLTPEASSRLQPHFYLAVAPKYVQVHVGFLGAEPQVHGRRADAQVADPHLAEEVWQHRRGEADLRRLRPDPQPEARLKQQEHRGRRPRLRGAGDRVARRPLAGPAAEAAKQLRQPTEVAERSRRFVEAFIRPGGLDISATSRFVTTVEELVQRPARPPLRVARAGFFVRQLYKDFYGREPNGATPFGGARDFGAGPWQAAIDAIVAGAKSREQTGLDFMLSAEFVAAHPALSTANSFATPDAVAVTTTQIAAGPQFTVDLPRHAVAVVVLDAR